MDAARDIPWGLIVAAIGGLAIGVEREWSGHAVGPLARFAGLRTFTLLGGLGGVAGWLWSAGAGPLGVVILAAAAAVTVAAYVAGSRTEIEGTTEVCALVVLAAGTLSGLGYVRLASAIIALTGVILLEKTRLHALVARIDDEELRAAMRFAVMAVVVLPLLPPGPFGPAEMIRPRELWLVVLLFSGLSFAAYIARRMAGVHQGNLLAGALGGLISSTSITLTFARASRDQAEARRSLACGVLAASTVLFVRVLAAVSLLNPGLLPALAGYFALPLTLGVAALVLDYRASAPAAAVAEDTPRNPLQFRTALQMTALFQAVIIAVAAFNRIWGEAGVTVAGALLGFADIDALTLSMARHAGDTVSTAVAARALVVGVLANTLLKLTLAAIIGQGAFRRLAVTGLGTLVLGLAASLAAGALWP